MADGSCQKTINDQMDQAANTRLPLGFFLIPAPCAIPLTPALSVDCGRFNHLVDLVILAHGSQLMAYSKKIGFKLRFFHLAPFFS